MLSSKRTIAELELITSAKAKSLKHQIVANEKLILATPQKREFFRFEAGQLVEYDLTKVQGQGICLTPEEISGMNEFSFAQRFHSTNKKQEN